MTKKNKGLSRKARKAQRVVDLGVLKENKRKAHEAEMQIMGTIAGELAQLKQRVDALEKRPTAEKGERGPAGPKGGFSILG